MTRSTSSRWLGFAGIAGGLLLLALFGLSATGQENWEDSFPAYVAPLYAVLLTIALFGLPGWKNAGGLALGGWALAALGAVGMTAGMALMVWFRQDAGWLLLMLGILGHAVGLLLYGIPALKRRLLGRWSILPLAIGVLAGPAVFLLEALEEMAAPGAQQQADPGFILWAVALGAGWTLLGFVLQSSGAVSPKPPAAEA